MSKPARVVGVLLVLVGLVGGSTCFDVGVGRAAASPEPSPSARPAGDEKLRLYLIPMGPRDLLPYRIDSVRPDGSLRLSVQIPEREAGGIARSGLSPGLLSSLTEGYLLGLTGLPEPESIARTYTDLTRGSLDLKGTSAIRVQVTEVLEGATATIRVGPQALAQLKEGDTLLMMRPPGSSTAQLQSVPDVVAIMDARGEVLGMDPRMAARLAQSINNLKQIGLAMHNFHDTFRQFPPAVVYGPDGKPWHSWRVLLLPYLEQQALYDQYRFDEPWDGPNNKRLLERMPPVYRDPVYGDADGIYTHYAVAVGKGAAFSPEGHRFDGDRSRVLGPKMGTPIYQFRDGTSNSLLAGSVSPERKIPWTKPEDVVFDDNFPDIGQEGGFAAPYKTDKAAGGVFLRADGSVTTIRTDIDMTVLRNLIQIADGHPVPEVPTLEPSRRSRQRQIPVVEIERTPAGATAKLVLETLEPPEKPARAEPPVPYGEAARRALSTNYLKQLALALHNYHDVHKSFPPAYSTDKEGKPLLSWRVQVLPYIEQQPLYKQFHLDEPWDSEHNKKLIPMIPRALRTPGSKAGPGKTNYLGVGGERGIFRGKDPIGFRDVTDGTSNTIMTVEVNDESAVIWTKPGDFVPDPENPKKGLLGVWDGGFLVGFADGSVRFFNEGIDDNSLRAMFTRNGGELVPPAPAGAGAAAPGRRIPVAPRPLPARPAPPARPVCPPAAEAPAVEEELEESRYAVPQGGVEVLLKFIQDLRRFRPSTAQQRAEHSRRSPAALKAAAQKILKLEKDQWSEAYQTALRVMLEDRVRTIRTVSPTEQRQAVDFVKTFLTAKLEKGIESQDARLAMSAATGLEYADNHELAAEAYQGFAELIGKSKDEALLKTAKMMEGAARRLTLLGKEMQIEGTTIGGDPFDWAAYRGKVVLVDFWTTWCPYCWPEIANAKKNYRLYHDRGFDVVGINLEEDTEKVKAYMEKEKLPWTVLHTKGAGWSHPMAIYYGVRGVPTMMLLDREGKVVSLRPRGSELDKLLKTLIGPPDAPISELVYIDIRSKGNAKLADDLSDSEGNNLAELPRGEQTFGDVKFRIDDSLIQLAGKQLPERPEKVQGIPVNRKFERLYILHGTGWAPPDGTVIGQYVVHYEDDTTATIPIVYGEDVRNWWNGDDSSAVTRGKVVWTGSNPAAKQYDLALRLYLAVWENPQPDKQVTSIDYVSTNTTDAAPFCVAITAKEAAGR